MASDDGYAPVALADTAKPQELADPEGSSDWQTLIADEGSLEALRRLLHAEFAQQRNLLAEMHEQQLITVEMKLDRALACLTSDQPLGPPPVTLRGSLNSEDASVASLFSKDVKANELSKSPEISQHEIQEEAGVESWEAMGGPHPHRESIRHSFVRRALVKQAEKAVQASTHLANRKKDSPAPPPLALPLQMALRDLVNSHTFTLVITCLIMLNVVLLGIEVDVSAQLGQDQVPTWFGMVNAVIVMVFVVEVALKCVAFGMRDFWCGADSKWNIFDSVIIFVSLVETVIDLWVQMVSHSMATSTHLRLMRSLRLLRALRGIRVVRIFRYVSALRTLLICIVSTMASLVWTLVLLVLLFYTFGVILTQLVTDYCRDAAIEDSGDMNAIPDCSHQLRQYWANVPASMLTLFMSISGGVSWEDALRPLETVSGLAVALMIIFIVITVLAVLNVVTGVFCNTAIESAHADKDIAAVKQLHKKAAQVQSLRNIFKEMDSENCSVVSLQDFQQALSQQKMSSFLESMGISTEDIWSLFMIMDSDGSGLVDVEEFVAGCMKLCGPAKSLQLAMMSYENKLTRQAIKKLTVELVDVRSRLTKMDAEKHASRLRGSASHRPAALKAQL